MSPMRITTRAMCQSLENSLSKVPAASESAETNRWVFRHVPGTRQFALFGEGLNHSKVSVYCTLPLVASQSSRRKRRTAPAHPKNGSATEGQPLPFACQLSNICRGFPLVLTLRCETRAGQLILNGAAFTRDATGHRQGPEASRNQLTYGGPQLTQTQLSSLVIGLRPMSSPLEEPNHPEALFFDSTSCFDNDAHNWHGHNPVHTVRPEVADAIAQTVACFGVDDTLAAHVAEKAHLVEQSERAAWRQLFNESILKG